jgi:hypothetical protein
MRPRREELVMAAALEVSQREQPSKLERAFLSSVILRHALGEVTGAIKGEGSVLLCGFADGRVYDHLQEILPDRRIIVCDWKFSCGTLLPPLQDRVDPREMFSSSHPAIRAVMCLVLKTKCIPPVWDTVLREDCIVLSRNDLEMPQSVRIKEWRLGAVGWLCFRVLGGQ